ncbi:MAG: CmpA/NrtA family ABC transporter substrate-binding protein [Pseudomonadota bacterium]
MADQLKIGYLGLNDAAPIIMAKELDLYAKYELDVHLVRQNSWSTLRDRLHMGDIHAAHMLAPMPLASSLGLGCESTDIFTPMVLSLNGNAITLSTAVVEEIKQSNQLKEIVYPLDASLLKAVVEQRHKRKKQKLRLAHVFPFSCHHYQLLDWLKRGGVNQEDIEFHVLPPHDMHFNLNDQIIDGYCVGGPWNAQAVREGTGITVATSCDIWGDAAEKVLGISYATYESRPEVFQRLINALLESCYWLDSPAHRFDASVVLSSPTYLNAPLDVVCPSLMGICLTERGSPSRDLPNYNIFGNKDNKLNIPNVADAHTFSTYMYSQHYIAALPSEQYLSQIYRSDLISKFALDWD